MPSIKLKYFAIKFDFITFYAAFLVWKDVKFASLSFTVLKYSILSDSWNDPKDDLLYFLKTL